MRIGEKLLDLWNILKDSYDNQTENYNIFKVSKYR